MSWWECWRKFRRNVSEKCGTFQRNSLRGIGEARSVPEKKKAREGHVLTEESLDNVGARLEARANGSTHRSFM
jgi:hypothetical protein